MTSENNIDLLTKLVMFIQEPCVLGKTGKIIYRTKQKEVLSHLVA